jgi:hypothetical protein
VCVTEILNPFLDLKGLSTVRRCNTLFDEYWQNVLKQNVIRMPEGCPTMDQAMDLAVMFSESNECTRENPVKVVVGEDLHGTNTDIHSSKFHGILAYVHGKVNIQLPSQHNTRYIPYDNVERGSSSRQWLFHRQHQRRRCTFTRT